MQVFEIGQYTIAAENADAAFGQYLEESNYLDDVCIGNLEEGESEECTITIRRLTEKEIKSKSMTCCIDGDCSRCAEREVNEPLYVSCEDLIADHKDFPCVIAKEF